ncbi:MAG: hypothetical protein ACI87N_002386 [Flavobacteriales bacterium]|jgi:hypothetical protein
MTLAICLSANATQWLTYYVYFETEYIQGTWTRADILAKSDYKYLAPEAFEDLLGSEDGDLINKLFSRLKEKKPNTYNWRYDLTIQNDTVILTPKGKIEQWATVKNEITATLILNNFKAVTFDFEDTHKTLTITDLTLPYFDLIETKNKDIKIVEPITTDKTVAEKLTETTQTKEVPAKEDNSLTILLIISVILNLGLIGLLIFKRNKAHKHNNGYT